jgi:hypothetical protein
VPRLSGLRWAAAALLGCAAPAAAAAQEAPPAADSAPGAPQAARPAVDSARTHPTPAAAGSASLALPRPRYRASPLLPPEHWAVRAAVRAEALGLAPGWLPAQGAVPRATVEAALRASAAGEGPAAALAARWHARFVQEFPEYRPDAAGSGVHPLGGLVAAGYERAEGRVAPAIQDFSPGALDDREGAVLRGLAGVRAGRGLALWAELRSRHHDAVTGDAVAGAGAFALAVGRGTVAYGPGRGGGIVYAGAAPLPRVEVSTTRPLRLPGVLGRAGGIALHTFLSRAGGEREPGEPWLWGARLAVQPHRRFTVGINRGALFGGPPGDPVTARNLAGMFVGVLRSEFENQVVSMDFRYRLPTERVLPATVYLEWGADDGAGAMFDVPGQVAGVFLPALPGVPALALGAELTRFGPRGDGNGPWYRHHLFMGQWARGDAVLGHPLGGQGHQATVYGEAELAGGRLRLDGMAFTRRRDDTNLFRPTRLGRSTGGALQALWRAGRHAELAAEVAVEDGGGWTEQRVLAEVRLRP